MYNLLRKQGKLCMPIDGPCSSRCLMSYCESDVYKCHASTGADEGSWLFLFELFHYQRSQNYHAINNMH
jgi:hypothetical protein